MMEGSNHEEMKKFLEVLGLREEPLGMYYTNQEPEEGFYPKPRKLPTAEEEKEGKIDWGSVFEKFSCVIGIIWFFL